MKQFIILIKRLLYFRIYLTQRKFINDYSQAFCIRHAQIIRIIKWVLLLTFIYSYTIAARIINPKQSEILVGLVIFGTVCGILYGIYLVSTIENRNMNALNEYIIFGPFIDANLLVSLLNHNHVVETFVTSFNKVLIICTMPTVIILV